jgi:hypothetical protein
MLQFSDIPAFQSLSHPEPLGRKLLGRQHNHAVPRFLLNSFSTNSALDFQWMCFRIEHPFIGSSVADMPIPSPIVKDQKQIFQCLTKQETLLVVPIALLVLWNIDIPQISVAILQSRSLLNGNPRIPGPVTVFLVFGEAVRMVIRLERFGS